MPFASLSFWSDNPIEMLLSQTTSQERKRTLIMHAVASAAQQKCCVCTISTDWALPPGLNTLICITHPLQPLGHFPVHACIHCTQVWVQQCSQIVNHLIWWWYTYMHNSLVGQSLSLCGICYQHLGREVAKTLKCTVTSNCHQLMTKNGSYVNELCYVT